MKIKIMLVILIMLVSLADNLIAQTPFLVKDINPSAGYSSPAFLTNVNGNLFFVCDDGVHGVELWKSDGSDSGTVMVKDINPLGSASPNNLTNVNGLLFFSASDSSHGAELWKSDGTAAGTVMIKDINPGLGNATPDYLTNVNGTLFFSADDGVNGIELWKSDGTPVGTELLTSAPGNATPNELTNVSGLLYFTLFYDGGSFGGTRYGRELWKSDGTFAGTVLVKDIIGGIGSSNPLNLTNVNGILFFSADDGIHGAELWKSNGIAAGTLMIKEIYPGSVGSLYPSANFTNVNGRLYFKADDGLNGVTELWESDGTDSGTVLLKDIFAGNTFGSSPDYLTNVNGTLYFGASDAANGHELWKSDGTLVGTLMIKDINSGSNDSNPTYIINIGGIVYLSATDATSTEGLWKSNGTNAGTIFLNGGVSYTKYLTNVGGKLFFSGYDSAHGQELWALNTGVGMFEFENLNSLFTISPNPATSSFTISSMTKLHPDSYRDDQLEIYNMLGEKVYAVPYDEQLTVNCEFFPKGIYVIKVGEKNMQSIQKLIIQ